MDDVKELLELARAAWPSLPLEDEAGLAAHLGRCRPANGEGRALRVGELFLSFACARGDALAQRELDQRFITVEAGKTAAQMRLSESTLEELKQQLRQRLLLPQGDRPPRIAEFAGRGPLATFVRVAAARVALNLCRQERRAARAEAQGALVALATEDPQLSALRDRYLAELNQAARDALAALDDAEKTLLRLNVVERLGLDALATLYQVGRSTVGRRIVAAREKVLAGTRRLLVERLRIDPAELESLLGLLRSQVDVSIERILVDAPKPAG